MLTAELQKKCEGLVTKHECFEAVKAVKKNKSPGLHGITIEFYEYFWSLIGDLPVNVFNESFENEKFCLFHREVQYFLLFLRTAMPKTSPITVP